MGLIKKNKIHNPQFLTAPAPKSVTEEDLGRVWVDGDTKAFKIAIRNKDTDLPELRNFLDTTDRAEIDETYFKGIKEELQTVELQVEGDEHYDNGYDFFTDPIYLENTTQEYDDYYAFFYMAVVDTTAAGYLRSISTDDGIKHVRKAVGTDGYVYDDQTLPVVKYTKIVLDAPAKEIVDIKFENKDSLTIGYTLTEDKQSILLYSDPDGFYNNKQVMVKYLI